MTAHSKKTSLTDLARAYRVARSALLTGSHDEATGEPALALLKAKEAAYFAFVDAGDAANDAEAIDMLLLAEDVLAEIPGAPCEERAIVQLALSRVAAYLGAGHRHSVQTPATNEAPGGFRGQVRIARARLAAVPEYELEVIFNGAARSKAAAFDALDVPEGSEGAMLALDQVSMACDVWSEAAALELRARLIRGEVLSDELAARVLLRACLAEVIYPLGASALAAAAAEALGELEAA